MEKKVAYWHTKIIDSKSCNVDFLHSRKNNKQNFFSHQNSILSTLIWNMIFYTNIRGTRDLYGIFLLHVKNNFFFQNAHFTSE